MVTEARSEPIRAVMICESPFWEHSLEWVIGSRDVEVVARAREIHRAPELVTRYEPDLLLVEANREADPDFLFKRLRQVHRDHHRSLTIVVCAGGADHVRDAALAGGAVRVVDAEDAAEFLDTLDFACAALEHGELDERPLLTRRELEILRFVSRGYTNGQVARALWVTDETVKYHLANVYRKLGVRSRLEAVSWAAENGLTTPVPVNGYRGRSARRTPRAGSGIPTFASRGPS
ncbi:MAG TPA: response regulator transcription factor [Gaiellaceae bacterium]|jgi:DNA-binding NarL/FixJ family response regulator|nr:response regulator transcription factor [Gaiellaceae bacterium]